MISELPNREWHPHRVGWWGVELIDGRWASREIVERRWVDDTGRTEAVSDLYAGCAGEPIAGWQYRERVDIPL